MKSISHPNRQSIAILLPVIGGMFLASCSTSGTARHPHHGHPHFEALDTNKDGNLSYAEFAKSSRAHNSKDPKAMFARLDTNKNGSISLIEIQEYRRQKKGSNPSALPKNQQKPVGR